MSSGTQLLSRPLAEDVLELVGLHFIESPLSWCSCREFESITHSVSSLLSHGQFINETCYFNYRIFKMKWVLFCFFLISKHAVAWIFFPCWRSDFCMEMIICIAILVFLGIWKMSPTCTVKDLVSKRSQWIMSSPRLLKHVLWTWFDNIAVLY